MKELSIIIPLYNVENYVIECLDSIVLQTGNEQEIILINDGSTDRTAKIVQKFINESKKNNIHLYSQENKGPSSARNLGIQKANGKYLMFVDSDDVVSNNALDIIKKTIDSEYDLTLFGFNYLQNNKVIKTWISEIPSFKIKENDPSELLCRYLEKIKYHINWYPWAKLFKSEIIKNHDIRFDENLVCCEDFDFLFRYLLNCKSIQYISEFIYLYRIDSERSIKKTRSYNNVVSELNSFYGIYEIIKNKRKKSLNKYIAENYFNTFMWCGELNRNEEKKLMEIVQKQKCLVLQNANIKYRIKTRIILLFGINKGKIIIEKLANIKLRVFNN